MAGQAPDVGTAGPTEPADTPDPSPESRASDLARHAIAVRERLGEVGDRLTLGERTLLSELLDRLS